MADKATTTASSIVLEDASLVRQVQEGDTGAFGRLVVKYQDRVVNLCWRMCGDLDDAQDLAQEAFVHALQKIATYRFDASFYTWLFRIAVNQSLSHRRKTRRVVLSLHDSDGRLCDEDRPGRTPRRETDASDDPIARLAARELQQELLDALDRLEEDERAIVVLRDIEALDYREIAEVLDVSVGTVKSRLHRSRMALRALMLRREHVSDRTAGGAKTAKRAYRSDAEDGGMRVERGS